MTTATTNEINTLEDLKSIGETLYIRWSNSIEKDQERGYSLRYGTQAESGLSTNNVNTTWADWRILRSIQEYRFTGAKYAYVLTGEVAGRGGDNEPLLKNIKVHGIVSASLITANWRKMKAENDLASALDRLSRITNDFACKSTQKEIERLMQLLEKFDH